jgi:hypothetical protein
MEDTMRQPQVDDLVLLTQDIPEQHLRQGSVGVVCSKWFAPSDAYEVDFVGNAADEHTRVLLNLQQVKLQNQPSDWG